MFWKWWSRQKLECSSFSLDKQFVSFTCSVYQIIVEEKKSRRVRKTSEILKCFPVPIHYQNASLLNAQYYFAAELPPNLLSSAIIFTVGDNKTYNGYWNAPLLPQKSYSIYYQAASRANGVRLERCNISWVPCQVFRRNSWNRQDHLRYNLRCPLVTNTGFRHQSCDLSNCSQSPWGFYHIRARYMMAFAVGGSR